MNSRFVRWRIGRTLQRLIEKNGWSIREAAEILGTNKDTLSRHLSGANDRYDPARILGWVMLLDGGEQLAYEMKHLADISSSRASGLAREHSGVPSWLITMEHEMSAIDMYQSELIHGLFQIPSYMDAISEQDQTATSEIAEKSRLSKLKRQDATFNKTCGQPPSIRMILNDTCLTRLDGTSIKKFQVAHLVELNKEDNIGIYILAIRQGIHPSMDGSYSIMTLDQTSNFQVVYTESLAGSQYYESPSRLEQYRKTFNATLAMSVELEEYLNANQHEA
ncbi:helix-turn-helix domain-containing protein [Natronoglycomyces albus]|uniref:Helix-turn-helix transcriptional regulator n=1 Tax=Natronoglycomyces albus TaxID=2811108 RepID=A0A895XLS0_9ACTN|nr:helix-turn-helix transcriptional regulator [Natronoglycomyces albus]QSB06641.1 helix-turn-helix transcriptional regulator [Natronoglycomyces albus]